LTLPLTACCFFTGFCFGPLPPGFGPLPTTSTAIALAVESVESTRAQLRLTVVTLSPRTDASTGTRRSQRSSALRSHWVNENDESPGTSVGRLQLGDWCNLKRRWRSTGRCLIRWEECWCWLPRLLYPFAGWMGCESAGSKCCARQQIPST